MYYKTDENGLLNSVAPKSISGYTQHIGELLNDFISYKEVSGSVYLNPDRYIKNTVEEFDAGIELIHPDDEVIFTQKRKDLVNKNLKRDLQMSITQTVGDEKELIKLVNMRVAFLERLVLVLAGNSFNMDISQSMKTDTQNLFAVYASKIANGEAKDTIDLEDYSLQLDEIISANNFISDSVESYRGGKE